MCEIILCGGLREEARRNATIHPLKKKQQQQQQEQLQLSMCINHVTPGDSLFHAIASIKLDVGEDRIVIGRWSQLP